MDIKLTYQPLKLRGGNISENDFDLYISQPRWAPVARKFAIEPLEAAMKKVEKPLFKAGDLQVKRKIQTRKVTSWGSVYDALVSFLEIRAEDSRNFDMDGIKNLGGIGYCILSNDLKEVILKQIKNSTSKSEFAQLFWPRKKKTEDYTNQIVLPDKDYRKITPDNMRIVAAAKKFCSGLEKEVVEPFKQANKEWYEQQTGYNMKNLPAEDSPVKRIRMIAGNKPIFIQLVREEVPEYKEVIGRVQSEIDDIENRVAISGYKVKQTSQGAYINLKNLSERLELDRLAQDKLVKIEGRFEIVP